MKLERNSSLNPSETWWVISKEAIKRLFEDIFSLLAELETYGFRHFAFLLNGHPLSSSKNWVDLIDILNFLP